MAELREIASGLEFPEGPIARSDGSVLVVEIKRQTLSRVSPDGEVTVVAKTGGGPNGAAIGPDGKVYICNNGGFSWLELMGMSFPGDAPPDYAGGSIQRVDLDTGEVEELYTACGDVTLKGPNDIVFDEHGGFWFTDLGKSYDNRTVDRGAVYYATTDGSTIREAIFPLDHPNGIGLSPDRTRLYVAESTTTRVWWWDIAEPGVVEPKPGFGPGGGTFLWSPTGYAAFDSLAVDGDGNVCVATLLNAGISVVSPEGELIDFVAGPPDDPMVTNICFGGDDLHTAYITSSARGRLYATDWPRPGLRLKY